MDESLDVLRVALVALYLPGLQRSADPPRSRWREVDHALRQRPGMNPVDALRAAGLWLEAGVLAEVGLQESARSLSASRRAITPVDSAYPSRWQFLPIPPPALWIVGEPPPPAEAMTVVGSRSLSHHAAKFARAAGRAVGEAGAILVSGGAAGADRLAAAGLIDWARGEGVPAPLIQVLPFGIARLDRQALGWRRGVEGCALSLAPPEEGFSSALAMERNALLYAASSRSLVVAARFREGGTWAGATAALRKRSSCIFVRADSSKASNALQALGAFPIVDAAAFPSAEIPSPQLRLVG